MLLVNEAVLHGLGYLCLVVQTSLSLQQSLNNILVASLRCQYQCSEPILENDTGKTDTSRKLSNAVPAVTVAQSMHTMAIDFTSSATSTTAPADKRMFTISALPERLASQRGVEPLYVIISRTFILSQSSSYRCANSLC